MTTQTQPTPGPWECGVNKIVIFAGDNPVAIVQTTCPEYAANAAFIVTACNVHDELVAALQLIEGTKGADAERVMREYARAALAKASGSEPARSEVTP